MTSSKKARPFPDRLVLENVPRVNFYEGGPRCPEDICLPSVLRAITKYLGDPDYGCNKCRARNPNLNNIDMGGFSSIQAIPNIE